MGGIVRRIVSSTGLGRVAKELGIIEEKQDQPMAAPAAAPAARPETQMATREQRAEAARRRSRRAGRRSLLSAGRLGSGGDGGDQTTLGAG